jgi:hypothetical protein
MGKHDATDDTLITPAAPQRGDHLWVLFIIAACALLDVWGSWVGIGAISGFPVLRLGSHGVSTDWVLAVVMEAYWAYALYAWLAASPGRRSRAFAMWTCAVIFALSLVGQVAYHEMTVPPDTSIGRRVVVGFTTILPVTVLAFIAVLIHLRHADRAEAAEAARRAAEAKRIAGEEAAAADERTALRAERETLREAVAAAHADHAETERQAQAVLEGVRQDAETALEDARRETAEVLARAERAEAKTDALARKLNGAKTGPGGRRTGPKSGSETGPEALTIEAQILEILDEAGRSGRTVRAPELVEKTGCSDGYARKTLRKLNAKDRPRDIIKDRSSDPVQDHKEDRS